MDGGWNGLPFPEEWGGQGLPWTVSTAVSEMWHSANTAFSLCPLLTQAGIELLLKFGTDEQKATYLEKLTTGEWTGTMCLTEPHAGTDVGALKTRAEKDGDHYRITGTKIFITYGDHDFTDNVIHMVLARTPGAPAGTKGISLFIVPKFLVNDDGSLGDRNDLRPVSLEHKLGIHASPTCVMSFGDNDGAIGYLIGEEQGGMKAMFTMMNNARLAVGLQGLAIAERAYQAAVDYASERTQGMRRSNGAAAPAKIIEYPDVRRTLMSMRCRIEAMRALTYEGAFHLDRAAKLPAGPEQKVSPGPYRPPDPADQGLVLRSGLRDRLRCLAGPRRHGLHRRNRHRPASAGRTHRDDLRRHQRHPGPRPGRPQAARRGRRARIHAF